MNEPNRDNKADSQGTSLSLLARVRANQADAWNRLVDLHAPLVYHWCRHSQLSPEDTADVFQEVFRSVAQNIANFRREKAGDSFRGWLRAITRNKINDHFRRQKDQALASGGTDAQLKLLDLPDRNLADDDPSEVNILQQQLHRVLDSIRGEFEERTWRAFWQVQMEGKSPKEIAVELKMTQPAVRKAKFRVLRRLREEMSE